MRYFEYNTKSICGLLRAPHGFTLVEMLVTISILMVIMSAMFTFLWGVSTHWNAGKDNAAMTDNARLGLNRMTRELKQASVVDTATASQIVFIVNYGTGNETITYGYSEGANGAPSIVWRSTSTASDQQVTLVNDVESAEFIYYGNDYKCDTQTIDGTVTWAELQACSSDPAAKIARVDISLTLKAGNENSQTFVDQAWLRNRIVTS